LNDIPRETWKKVFRGEWIMVSRREGGGPVYSISPVFSGELEKGDLSGLQTGGHPDTIGIFMDEKDIYICQNLGSIGTYSQPQASQWEA
jgi:hypothetical protein